MHDASLPLLTLFEQDDFSRPGVFPTYLMRGHNARFAKNASKKCNLNSRCKIRLAAWPVIGKPELRSEAVKKSNQGGQCV